HLGNNLCTSDPLQLSASLSGDHTVCSFSLSDFNLELLQPTRCNKPAAVRSDQSDRQSDQTCDVLEESQRCGRSDLLR
ncbi:hypothetical protein ABVT39_005563, partial [Epinephelus coioides]